MEDGKPGSGSLRGRANSGQMHAANASSAARDAGHPVPADADDRAGQNATGYNPARAAPAGSQCRTAELALSTKPAQFTTAGHSAWCPRARPPLGAGQPQPRGNTPLMIGCQVCGPTIPSTAIPQ
jgi:hypothetical protein